MLRHLAGDLEVNTRFRGQYCFCKDVVMEGIRPALEILDTKNLKAFGILNCLHH